MALDLNSPSVANPYSGTDGGLTFLKLQEDAFKNAEALIVLHRNERALEVGPARIDPETNYQESRNTQNADVLKEAKIAARIIDEILMNPSLSADVRAKLETSRSKLDLVINNNGAIGSSDTMLTIMGMVGEAYAEVEAAETASAAEAITGFARASNTIAVHQAVERQRPFYRSLDDNDWKRVEVLSRVVTHTNIHEFADAVFADDQYTQPSLRLSNAINFAHYCERTDSGQHLMANQKILSLNAPDALAKSNAELITQNKAVDKILASKDSPEELTNMLQQLRTSKIFSQPVMDEVVAYENAKTPEEKAAIQKKIVAGGQLVLDKRIEDDLSRIKEAAKEAGLSEEQFKRQFSIGYDEQINPSNKEAVLRGIKDLHENNKWMDNADINSPDGKRNANAISALKQWDALIAEGKDPKKIDELLRAEFGADAIHDAVAKKAHPLLAAAGKIENVHGGAMHHAHGKAVEPYLGALKDPHMRQQALADIAEEMKRDYPQLAEGNPKDFKQFVIKTVEAVEDHNNVKKCCRNAGASHDHAFSNIPGVHGVGATLNAAGTKPPPTELSVTENAPKPQTTIAEAGQALTTSKVTATQNPTANTPTANAAAPLTALAAQKPKAAATQITA